MSPRLLFCTEIIPFGQDPFLLLQMFDFSRKKSYHTNERFCLQGLFRDGLQRTAFICLSQIRLRQRNKNRVFVGCLTLQ